MRRSWLCFVPMLAWTGCTHRNPISMDDFAPPSPTELSSFKPHLKIGLTMTGSGAHGGPDVTTTMYTVDLPFDQTASTLEPILKQAGWQSLGIEERVKRGIKSETFTRGEVEKLQISQDKDPDTNAVEVGLVHIVQFIPKPTPPRRGRPRLF